MVISKKNVLLYSCGITLEVTGAFTWSSLYDICHKMSTKPANTRATTATRAGCVRHGVGRKTSQGAAAEMLPKTHYPTYSR